MLSQLFNSRPVIILIVSLDPLNPRLLEPFQ